MSTGVQTFPFLWFCEGGCGGSFRIFAKVRGQYLCHNCWRERGSLFPIASDAAEAFAAEQATRNRMLQRGGSDRYRARAGKT